MVVMVQAVDRPAVGTRTLKVGDQRAADVQPQQTEDEADHRRHHQPVQQHAVRQRLLAGLHNVPASQHTTV